MTLVTTVECLFNRSDLERDSAHSSLVHRSRQLQQEHQQTQREQSPSQTIPPNYQGGDGGGRGLRHDGPRPILGRQSSHEERHQQLLREANRRASLQYRCVPLYRKYGYSPRKCPATFVALQAASSLRDPAQGRYPGAHPGGDGGGRPCRRSNGVSPGIPRFRRRRLRHRAERRGSDERASARGATQEESRRENILAVRKQMKR